MGRASELQTLTDITPLTILPISGIPLIQKDDDLVGIVLDALERMGNALQDRDVLVVTSKIISKAEGRLIDLRTVTPGEAARELATETGKDPRIVELVLQESRRISRKRPGVLVTEHRLGFISANAGIDQSNVNGSDDFALLLPQDPDSSAAAFRSALHARTGRTVGIVISDTHGRPFRMGNVGVAIGVAGIPAVLDLRGQSDLFGRVLRVTTQGYADLIASAAHLVCGEGSEGLPVVLLQGLRYPDADGKATDLIRPPTQDLYR